MVGVLGIVAALYLLQVTAQLVLNQVLLTDEACLLDEVVCQHGQTGPWSSVSISKYVELPVGLCILNRHTVFQVNSGVGCSCSSC